MDALVPGGIPFVGPEQEAFHAAANFVDRADYATLILNRGGYISGCAASAETLFGDTETRLIGRRISEFVPGLLRDGYSPSFSARYLVHPCHEGEWREFAARDTLGRALAVEIKLMPMPSGGGDKEMYLLNLRRSKAQESMRLSS